MKKLLSISHVSRAYVSAHNAGETAEAERRIIHAAGAAAQHSAGPGERLHGTQPHRGGRSRAGHHARLDRAAGQHRRRVPAGGRGSAWPAACIALSWGISAAFGWPRLISAVSIVASVVFCIPVGPSRKAAALDPIEALRYE